MSYVGSAPSPSQVQFSTLDAQAFDGDGSTTAFTLNRAVSIAASIEVTVNNVQQSPYDGSYTVNGTTTLTFSEAPSSGTDNIYVRFLDYPLASITPGNDTVGIDQLSATGTPSSSTFLRGDNSWQAVSVTPTAVSSQANTATDYFDLPAGTTAQRPGTPATGMIRYNTTNSEYEVYDGSEWKGVVTQAAGTYSVEYLVVAGGGAGGSNVSNDISGGGGGAGGYIASSTVLTPSTGYSVVIGAGGTGSATATSGNDSTFSSSVALAGGRGSGYSGSAYYPSLSGGSGGGGGWNTYTGASGTTGQGYAGGAGKTSGPPYCAGGGGGASEAGADFTSSTSGDGGDGLNWQSLGTYYAGGGGGGSGAGGSPGSGGLGGGGAGGTTGTAGTANTGGGGGGAGTTSGGVTTYGGNGGSGIVIIRYSGSQRGSGGTVTSAGGYTYHTFTSSGTYTA